MLKRVLSLVLALITALTIVVPVSSPASAAYENTYTNTGDQRADMIGVALTQVGYREGYNNDTKYGDWYGLPNMPWCAMFVSWVANQAGVPTSVIKKAAKANPSSFGFSNYYSSSEYTPQGGDLFFKKGFSHVGMVYYVDGSYFYTLEGNTNDSGGSEGVGVMIRRRKLSDYYFVSPNYTSDASHEYEKHYDDAHPHRIFYTCTHCPSSYYVDDYLTLDNCKECIQANCSHEYESWSRSGDSKHSRVCIKCEKKESEEHDWVVSRTIKEATCNANGAAEQKCADCGMERTVTVSATGEHNYGEWTFDSDENHVRTCKDCGTKDTQAHELGEEPKWNTNATEHWYECEVCKEKVQLKEHAFGNDCIAPCADCGFVREDGHFFSDTYTSDAQAHWYDCEKCDEVANLESHVFTAECDETCDTCTYTREVTHTYGKNLVSDATGHWYECTVCGKKDAAAVHIPGPEATEEAAQTCTLCDYEIHAKLDHVHKFDMQSNTTTHWGTCSCGETMGPESHMWDMSTGACSMCNLSSATNDVEQFNWDIVWVIAGGVLAISAITPILVAISKKTKARREMAGDPYSY